MVSVADVFSRKKVIISGGLGFIGSNLAIRLVGLGADVTVIDSLIPEYGGNLFNLHSKQDKVRINSSEVGVAHSMALTRLDDRLRRMAQAGSSTAQRKAMEQITGKFLRMLPGHC